MYEIGVVVEFEASHRLEGDFGPAALPHGHTYRVEVAARGRTVRSDGTLFDISLLERAVGDATRALDHRDLGELPAFEGRNSTAENVAKHLFDEIARCVAGRGLASLAVKVWESPAAYASYEALLVEQTTGRAAGFGA